MSHLQSHNNHQSQNPLKPIYQQIKQLVSIQAHIWKTTTSSTQCINQTLHYQYMTQCYQILLRSILYQQKQSISINQYSNIISKNIQIIDSIINKYLISTIDDQKMLQITYQILWQKYLQIIWSEYLQSKFQQIHLILSNNQHTLSNHLISIFKTCLEDQSSNDTPIFSSDQQINPITNIIQKPNKKYTQKTLPFLLGTQQISLMQSRINQLTNQKSKVKLIRHLTLLFRTPKSNTPSTKLFNQIKTKTTTKINIIFI